MELHVLHLREEEGKEKKKMDIEGKGGERGGKDF